MIDVKDYCVRIALKGNYSNHFIRIFDWHTKKIKRRFKVALDMLYKFGTMAIPLCRLICINIIKNRYQWLRNPLRILRVSREYWKLIPNTRSRLEIIIIVKGPLEKKPHKSCTDLKKLVAYIKPSQPTLVYDPLEKKRCNIILKVQAGH